MAAEGLISGWVRRPYELRGGRLSPVSGGSPELFNPLKENVERVRGDGGRPLLLHLADLGQLCSQLPDPSRKLEEFSSRWGLLGLFQHNAEVILIRDSAPSDVDPPGAGMSWTLTPDELFRALARQACVPDRRLEWGRVRFRPVPMVQNDEDLAVCLRRYFPGLLDREGRIADLSGKSDADLRRLSWDYLAEPEAEVLTHAKRFGEAFEHASVAGMAGDEQTEAKWLASTLEANLMGVRPRPHATWSLVGGQTALQGRWNWGWQYPSLLSMAYGQLLDALVKGLHPGFCKNPSCGRTFLGRGTYQLYCSARCLNTVKHRSLRRRRMQGATGLDNPGEEAVGAGVDVEE